MTKNQQVQHYMYAKSKLVYTIQEMNEKKVIQDEETGTEDVRELYLSMCFPIFTW